MLAVSPLRSTGDESQGEMESFSDVGFVDGNLLESINFDDLFADFNDQDVLPDLQMDPEILLAEFSLRDETETVSSSLVSASESKSDDHRSSVTVSRGEGKAAAASSNSLSGLGLGGGEEIVSKGDESAVLVVNIKEREKGRKSSKIPHQGKKKVKVDWTPELHRRFVEAVEQLGVDKAVPSRILELMGIHCLTRHNIASHLQKYRSQRKHMLAREAEAASWSSRRRQILEGGKRDMMNPYWLINNNNVAPTTTTTTIMGFPPPMTPHFRPFHVWGHQSQTIHPSFMHICPKQHLPPTWQLHPHHQRAPKATTRGTPCFPQSLTTTRFGSTPTVPGIVPPPRAIVYQVHPRIPFPAGQSPPRPLLDFHPSKESVDAAISEALSKPWLPLPLGLKAPAVDGVIGELQRQGIPKIPPSCA